MTEPATSVTLEIAATTADISLARTLTAAMGARADLTLDQLEDARLAVDEAASQLIAEAPAGARLRLNFEAVPGELVMTASAPSLTGDEFSRETFAWTVLSALATGVETRTDAGTTTVRLVIRRPAPVDA